MNRQKLEQGFGELIKLQNYIGAAGISLHIKRVTDGLNAAMEFISEGCNEVESEENAEWKKQREAFWAKALLDGLNQHPPLEAAAFADEALKLYEKRFQPKIGGAGVDVAG